MVDVWLPYGKTDVCIRVPARNLLGTIEPAERQGALDAKAEVERALKEPIGSKRLCEIAKPESKVAVVVDDAIGQFLEKLQQIMSIFGKMAFSTFSNKNRASESCHGLSSYLVKSTEI